MADVRDITPSRWSGFSLGNWSLNLPISIGNGRFSGNIGLGNRGESTHDRDLRNSAEFYEKAFFNDLGLSLTRASELNPSHPDYRLAIGEVAQIIASLRYQDSNGKELKGLEALMVIPEGSQPMSLNLAGKSVSLTSGQIHRMSTVVIATLNEFGREDISRDLDAALKAIDGTGISAKYTGLRLPAVAAQSPTTTPAVPAPNAAPVTPAPSQSTAPSPQNGSQGRLERTDGSAPVISWNTKDVLTPEQRSALTTALVNVGDASVNPAAKLDALKKAQEAGVDLSNLNFRVGDGQPQTLAAAMTALTQQVQVPAAGAAPAPAGTQAQGAPAPAAAAKPAPAADAPAVGAPAAAPAVAGFELPAGDSSKVKMYDGKPQLQMSEAQLRVIQEKLVAMGGPGAELMKKRSANGTGVDGKPGLATYAALAKATHPDKPEDINFNDPKDPKTIAVLAKIEEGVKLAKAVPAQTKVAAAPAPQPQTAEATAAIHQADAVYAGATPAASTAQSAGAIVAGALGGEMTTGYRNPDGRVTAEPDPAPLPDGRAEAEKLLATALVAPAGVDLTNPTALNAALQAAAARTFGFDGSSKPTPSPELAAAAVAAAGRVMDRNATAQERLDVARRFAPNPAAVPVASANDSLFSAPGFAPEAPAFAPSREGRSTGMGVASHAAALADSLIVGDTFSPGATPAAAQRAAQAAKDAAGAGRASA